EELCLDLTFETGDAHRVGVTAQGTVEAVGRAVDGGGAGVTGGGGRGVVTLVGRVVGRGVVGGAIGGVVGRARPGGGVGRTAGVGIVVPARREESREQEREGEGGETVHACFSIWSPDSASKRDLVCRGPHRPYRATLEGSEPRHRMSRMAYCPRSVLRRLPPGEPRELGGAGSAAHRSR